MRDKSSVLFKQKTYMIFTKGAHQSGKFQTFDCSGEISPNLHFDRLLARGLENDLGNMANFHQNT